MCRWVVLSAVVLVVLLTLSHKNDSWSLNMGETRKVSTPWFTDALKIQSNVADGAHIFALDKCPALTGPKLSLDSSLDISLAQNDYQYDFFYLNAGSTISVTVQQSQGASNILLLRGKDTLDRWEHDEDDSNRDNVALMKRYAGANQNVQLQYTVSKSDFYVAVYDNASSKHGHANVTYHVELTTYNLKGLSPITSSCNSATNTCFVKKHFDCVLVQATNSTNDATVTVSITSDRKMGLLLFLSCIPILLGLLQKRRSGDQEMPQASPAPAVPAAPLAPSAPIEPLAPMDEPPMAHAVAIDYDSIPILPTENIMPVPPPQVPTDKV